MALKCGIVGLPNVGKSTLFNAMTRAQIAQAENYPFCTIEPNAAKVCTCDERLEKIAKIANSEKVIHSQLEIVDIAGLVKGASCGEGLGNKFLSHIREVDLIIHVLRCFGDKDISHVNNKVDPIEDLQTVETELMLADIQSIEKKIQKEKKNKNLIAVLQKVLTQLQEGKAISSNLSQVEEVQSLNLLTAKPIMYVCNVEEKSASNGNHYSQKVVEFAKKNGFLVSVVSAFIEQEISAIQDQKERQSFLEELGVKSDGLSQIADQAAKLIDLITFFTAGPKESRAWFIKNGCTAPKAAGVIHSDFEEKFIKAEVISFKDYIENEGEKNCKNSGKLRIEGREYVVKDGDIMHFRHGQ